MARNMRSWGRGRGYGLGRQEGPGGRKYLRKKNSVRKDKGGKILTDGVR